MGCPSVRRYGCINLVDSQVTYAQIARRLKNAAAEFKAASAELEELDSIGVSRRSRVIARMSTGVADRVEYLASERDPLPPGQARVLKFFADYIAQHGHPPTRAVCAKALGFKSDNAVQDHLWALARRGKLEICDCASRCGKVTLL